MFVGIEYELEEIANCKKEMKIYEAGTKRKPHKKSGVSVKLTSKYRNTTYTKTGIGPNFGVGLLHECGST